MMFYNAVMLLVDLDLLEPFDRCIVIDRRLMIFITNGVIDEFLSFLATGSCGCSYL